MESFAIILKMFGALAIFIIVALTGLSCINKKKTKSILKEKEYDIDELPKKEKH